MEILVNNKKRDAILNASKKLFWKHGFRRVSVEEICQEAKTSKMTFYRFFPNKIELAKNVLDRYLEESMITFRKITGENSSGSVKMEKLIQMKLDGSNDISKEFIQDFLIINDLDISNYLENKLKLFWEEGIAELKNGQKEGWIRSGVNIEFLFYFSEKIIPLINDDKALKFFNSPKELIGELTNLIIYGISPQG